LDSLGIGHVTASRISAIGQWTLYEGNSALRGGRAARIEPPGRRIDDLQITPERRLVPLEILYVALMLFRSRA
jgi:hypothetical protein